MLSRPIWHPSIITRWNAKTRSMVNGRTADMGIIRLKLKRRIPAKSIRKTKLYSRISNSSWHGAHGTRYRGPRAGIGGTLANYKYVRRTRWYSATIQWDYTVRLYGAHLYHCSGSGSDSTTPVSQCISLIAISCSYYEQSCNCSAVKIPYNLVS